MFSQGRAKVVACLELFVGGGFLADVLFVQILLLLASRVRYMRHCNFPADAGKVAASVRLESATDADEFGSSARW